MSETNHNAYGTSIALHLAVVVAIVIVAYSASTSKQISPKVLELVAGEGNNYAATVAPALGTPGVKLNMPATPQPTSTPPTPEPKPEAAPIEQAPPEPVTPPITAAPQVPAKTPPKTAKKTPPAKTPPKPVSPENLHLDKDFKRIENKRATRLVNQYLKQKEAMEKKQAAAARAAEIARLKGARVDAEGIAKGVVGGSTENKEGGAGGKALSREEQDLLGSYFAMLEARVKDNHVSPDGASDSLACKVSFFVAADGTISRVHIVHSSGNAAFDKSVVDAFYKTANVGPRPDHHGDEQTVEFSMREDSGN